MSDAGDTQRLDKWLWIARFFKTRSMSAAVCGKGRVRVNRVVVEKAHYGVRPGDVLTFPQADRIRVVRILGIGARRGPAREAQLLYEDLDAGDSD
ncbi:MAG: RNA-binding S4 domain-containing protein [Alphaproteobacteria bacterium]